MSITKTNVLLANTIPLDAFLSDFTILSPVVNVSSGTLSAVRATLKALYLHPTNRSHSGTPIPLLVPEQLALVPDFRESAHGTSVTIVDGLTFRANEAAASAACGSVLAGHTSESDEFGDVSFWLGEGSYGSGQELAILRALGLENEAQDEIQRVSLEPSTRLPTSLSSGGFLAAEVRAFSDILSALQDLHCFRVRVTGDERDGTLVLYILTGKTEETWTGLLGLGVWSDA